MKTTFIPLDYDYFDFKDRNYAKIIGRDEKGKRICIIDTCPIYFWAILKDDIKEKNIQTLIKKIESIQLDSKGRKTKVEKTEIHHKKFLGKDVKAIKIFITNFKDAQEVANKINFEEIDKRREYDLNFITKYIIEKKLEPLIWYEIEGELLNNSEKYGNIDMNLNVDLCLDLTFGKIKKIEKEKFSPNIITYDIETDEIEIGKGEILMISIISKNFKKIITWKKTKLSILNKEEVEFVKDESELIEKFCEYINKISPDFLVGYFSDAFDLPYLKARAEKHKIKLAIGLDNSQPIFTRGINMTGKIDGIIHIDLFKFIKTAYSQYLDSETLTLNDVAKALLNDSKKEFKIEHSSKLDEEKWEKYFEYNLYDSNLTFKLFEKIWPDLMEFTKVMKEPLFDVSRNGMSKNVESYIIHNLEKFNEIAEKRPLNAEISERMEREKYEGAFVFQPNPGLYENLAMFDFTSYWPSIIVTFNLSKSTFVENPKKNKNLLEVNTGKHTLYFSKNPGFFPEMLKEIVKKRKQFKEELKKQDDPITKARSNAFKLLANASYGYQGFFGARYYCPQASEATTSISREYIQKIIKIINEEGFKTIYSDTDSIALTLNKKTNKQTLDFLENINKELPGIMELELEDFYKRGIWVTKRTGDFGAKKKYALITKENKLKIRGFETVRRDWCKLARELQNEVIKLILKEGNEQKALEYTKKISTELKERKVELEKLIIKTQLKKPLADYKSISPHVIAAKKMKERGTVLSIGKLIEYYISEINDKKSKLVREKVKLPDEEGEYNIDYYLEKQILPAVENIFQIFNVNIREIIKPKKQKTLSDF